MSKAGKIGAPALCLAPGNLGWCLTRGRGKKRWIYSTSSPRSCHEAQFPAVYIHSYTQLWIYADCELGCAHKRILVGGHWARKINPPRFHLARYHKRNSRRKCFLGGITLAHSFLDMWIPPYTSVMGEQTMDRHKGEVLKCALCSEACVLWHF